VKGRPLRFRTRVRSSERLGERDVAVLRDDGGDFRRDLPKRGAILILPQQREHFAAKSSDLSVGKYGFEAVADLGPVLMVVHRDENHDAAIVVFRSIGRSVGAFGSDAPFFEEEIGEVRGGVSL
jgi:hypothetical protein